MEPDRPTKTERQEIASPEPILSNESAQPAAEPVVGDAPTLSPESLDIQPGEFLFDEELSPADRYAPKLRTRRRKIAPVKKRRWRLHHQKGQGKFRLQMLAGTLVVLALVLGVAVATRTHVEPLPVLTLGDLPVSHVLLDVQALPPSLYVEVDEASWGRLTSKERQALVEEIGVTAEAAGYSGALLRTVHGLSVAHWMQASGARLLEKPDSPS